MPAVGVLTEVTAIYSAASVKGRRAAVCDAQAQVKGGYAGLTPVSGEKGRSKHKGRRSTGHWGFCGGKVARARWPAARERGRRAGRLSDYLLFPVRRRPARYSGLLQVYGVVPTNAKRIPVAPRR